MKNDAILVGIDLGTFKTSIACSNGRRDVMPSAVGWPKDHVARTMLDEDVIFGDGLERHRLALDICRPFEKGLLKYTNPREVGASQERIDRHRAAARLLVKQAIRLIHPPAGRPIYGVIGAPSRASVENKQQLLDAASNEFRGVMIVPEPFAVAYGMNRLTDTLVVDIGAGTIDICPIYGTYPSEDDQFTIPLGGDIVDQEFFDLLRSAHPEAQLTLNMARQIKEKYGFVHDASDSVNVTLRVDGHPRVYDVTDLLKQACSTIVDPIVDGLKRVVARLDPEYQAPLLSNVLLGGGGSQLKGLDVHIEMAMENHGDVCVTKVYDSMFAGASGALKLAMSLPDDMWKCVESAVQEKSAA